MGKVRRDAYLPDTAAADVYDGLYAHYVALHDYFGRGGPTHARAASSGRGRTPASSRDTVAALRREVCRAARGAAALRPRRAGRAATSPRACPART